jgi:hypothetical protein
LETSCPRCGAPRVDAPDCPRCGVLYDRARARSGATPAAPPEPTAFAPPLLREPTASWDAGGDQSLERRLRLWALPVALGLSWLVAQLQAGRMVLRIFFGMWLHELGHATAAWLCGRLALPGPWLTRTGEERSLLLLLLLAVALVVLLVRALRAGNGGAAAALGLLLAAQLGCSLLLDPRQVKTFIVFAGDGGALLFGALCMASVYAGARGVLGRGWLRWGLLVIGAGAFADVAGQWWAARSDPDQIPYGMNEGVGLSDPSVLSDQLGWSAGELVSRYLVLAAVCLAGLAALYLAGLQERAVRGGAGGPPE